MRNSEKQRVKQISDFFSEELADGLRKLAKVRFLEKNEILFTHGSPPDSLFCVRSGRVSLSASIQGGREAVISVLEPGHWFGEMSLFMDSARIYEAKALVGSEVLVVAADDFRTLLHGRSDFIREFLRLICLRYRWTLEWIDEAILLPFSVRLARRILAAKETSYVEDGSGNGSNIRISQEELGDMLGVSRQTVRRKLREWENEGCIKISYGKLTLIREDIVKKHAEGRSNPGQ